jgi:hypothetical protein
MREYLLDLALLLDFKNGEEFFFRISVFLID